MDDFDLGDIDSGLDLTADSALSDLHHNRCDQHDSLTQSLLAAHIANGMDPMRISHRSIPGRSRGRSGSNSARRHHSATSAQQPFLASPSAAD